MNDTQAVQQDPAKQAQLARLAEQFDRMLTRLEQTSRFAKAPVNEQVLDVARRLLALPGGADAVYRRVPELERAGVFENSDWAHPELLQPTLAANNTLRLGPAQVAVLECLSELRLLAVARGEYFHPSIAAEQAHHFLGQVLALNLHLLFDQLAEADRIRLGNVAGSVRNAYLFLVERIGYENILDRLIDEVERILAQRPIKLDHVKAMITEIAQCLVDPDVRIGGATRGAERLISALYGPTASCREDPGLEVYAERLQDLDASGLAQEASSFARSMYDTGLVSPYHTVFLRQIRGNQDDLIPTALGLSTTGRDAYLCYQQLINELIDDAIYPETAQAVYGMAEMLERAILYQPSIAPALWRQIRLPLHPESERVLQIAMGTARPPRVFLLAGVLSLLGQPLGLGQGNNPTCQSARALSMWASNDPDYLLQMIAWAARDSEVVMHFEGQRISSAALPAGLSKGGAMDVDAVSAVVVPHLDRIYMEMGRLCADRGEDPHRWINPEFHGWWVGRGFSIAVDVATGKLADYDDFIRRFYASYHPLYNGNQPIIHPQPAGVALTDSAGRFVGWHAITIMRVAIDKGGAMRIYFFNPNNDSGQDWGHGVVASTAGYGEQAGESSLPIEQFASRLYIFHYDPSEQGDGTLVPEETVQEIIETGRGSWAADR